MALYQDILDVLERPLGGQKPAPSVKFTARIPSSTKRRFDSFFEKSGNKNKSGAEKFAILLDLAETHPDVAENLRLERRADEGSSTLCKSASESSVDSSSRRSHLADGRARPKKRPRGPNFVETRGGDDGVLTTFRDDFNGYDIDDGIAEHELHVGSSQIAEDHSDAEEFGVDRNNTGSRFDDGCDEDDDTESFTMKGPRGKDILYAPPLLSKNYYTAFSAEAQRRPCVAGGTKMIDEAANERRMLVEQQQLIKLLENIRCPVASCGAMIDKKTIKFRRVGYCNEVNAWCLGACHDFRWATSSRVTHATKENSEWYALNTMVPAAILVTGNNYARMQRFFHALNVDCGSESHHFRLQRGAVIPAVAECTEICQAEMLEKLRQQNARVILAGDAQFDSPGKCAETGTYSLSVVGLEKEVDGEIKFHNSGYIISQAVAHRNHVDGHSPLAEPAGLHAALRPLYDANIHIAEIVTDEHAKIKGDFKKSTTAAAEDASNIMRRKNASKSLDAFQAALNTKLMPCSSVEAPQLMSFYAGIHHSIDIWHKAKNIKKYVDKLAKKAPLEERKIYHLRAMDLSNHLWHSAEKAEGDPNKFKALWLRCIPHITGDHSGCSHKTGEDRTPPLKRDTDAFAKLSRYINGVGELAEHLCRFRHTGTMESFHALCVAYAAKRHRYDYDVLVMRKRLAALNHNHNALRALQFRNGQVRFYHRWSKAARDYVPTFLREPKQYDYIRHLMANILCKRATSDYDFRCGSGTVLSDEHPWRIKRTIADFEQTPAETFAHWTSRLPSNRPENVSQSSLGADTPSTSTAPAPGPIPDDRPSTSAAAPVDQPRTSSAAPVGVADAWYFEGQSSSDSSDEDDEEF